MGLGLSFIQMLIQKNEQKNHLIMFINPMEGLRHLLIVKLDSALSITQYRVQRPVFATTNGVHLHNMLN